MILVSRKMKMQYIIIYAMVMISAEISQYSSVSSAMKQKKVIPFAPNNMVLSSTKESNHNSNRFRVLRKGEKHRQQKYPEVPSSTASEVHHHASSSTTTTDNVITLHPPSLHKVITIDSRSSSLVDLPMIDYGNSHPFDKHINRYSKNVQPDIYLNDDSTSLNFEPIRIHFDYTNLRHQLDNDKNDDYETQMKNEMRIKILQEEILPSISRQWSQMISVVPVQNNNLYVSDAECAGIMDFDGDVYEQVEQKELVDLHTDQIPNKNIHGYNNKGEKDTTSQEFQKKNQIKYYKVPNADLFVFVSALDWACKRNDVGEEAQLNSENSETKMLASANICSLDQYDRPIVGFINFCLDAISVSRSVIPTDTTLSPSSLTLSSNKKKPQSFNYYIPKHEIESIKSTARHELTHILGMNNLLFKFFRTETGVPLTPRPFSTMQQNLTCPNGNLVTKDSSFIMPSSKTLKYVEQNGLSYFEFVTPRVVQVARNQFDCQALSGVRLENQNTNPYDCFGSHFEERFYFADALSAIYSPHFDYFTPMILAILEDSGFYRANYSETFTEISPFGHGAGCDFIQKACSEESSNTTTRGFFCDDTMRIYQNNEEEQQNDERKLSQEQIQYYNQKQKDNLLEKDKQNPHHRRLQQSELAYTCDFSHRYKAGCDLADYGTVLPEYMQYFPLTNPSVGTFVIHEADFCPIAHLNPIDCEFPVQYASSSTKVDGLDNLEVFGKHSHCINFFFDNKSLDGKKKRPLCIESYCNKEDYSLDVYIEGQKYICTYDFQVIQIQQTQHYNKSISANNTVDNLNGMEGPPVTSFECPRLTAVCPNVFGCKANCEGKGICNFHKNSMPKQKPECICFDTNDTTESCSNSTSTSVNWTISNGGLEIGVDNNLDTSTSKPSSESKNNNLPMIPTSSSYSPNSYPNRSSPPTRTTRLPTSSPSPSSMTPPPYKQQSMKPNSAYSTQFLSPFVLSLILGTFAYITF